MTVTIEFDATVAWMVKEQRQAGDEWQDREDGGGALTRKISDPAALSRWLLRFGVHAQLLAPADLRAAIAEQLRGVRAMYKRK